MANGPLQSGDLHHRAHINVPVGHQLSSPVPVSMDGRVGGGGAGYAGDHEGGQRPGRIVPGQQPVRCGYIHIDQAVHRHLASASAHGRSDQPPIWGKRPHLHLARTFNRHH